ncbi:hypothetical protein EX30DRAFT_44099 [Ascodesmis nigricans]|uniref:Uncharacterized protein n=1 Tax=Ascodesmis nigricans TaxID=341454 RepID=A0A4S2MW82_9PEZI|nr:hypothetical protein EX30DRAFT_44099 [Ascodesmis nigricans]
MIRRRWMRAACLACLPAEDATTQRCDKPPISPPPPSNTDKSDADHVHITGYPANTTSSTPPSRSLSVSESSRYRGGMRASSRNRPHLSVSSRLQTRSRQLSIARYWRYTLSSTRKPSNLSSMGFEPLGNLYTCQKCQLHHGTAHETTIACGRLPSRTRQSKLGAISFQKPDNSHWNQHGRVP